MDVVNLKDLEGDDFLAAITKCIDEAVSHAVLFPELGLDYARALGELGDVRADEACDHGCHGEDVIDACAVGMMKCLEAYAPVCKDWTPVLEIMQKADHHALCEDTVHASERNLSIVKANLEYQKLHSKCWLCKGAPALDDDAFSVKMFKKISEDEEVDSRVDASGNRVEEKIPCVVWRTVGVSVPLCRKCAVSLQKRQREIDDRIWFCDSYLDIMKSSFPDGFEHRAAKVREKRDRFKEELCAGGCFSDFPEVKQLLDDGYQFGVQPAESRHKHEWVLGMDKIDILAASNARHMPRICDISHGGVKELEYPCD